MQLWGPDKWLFEIGNYSYCTPINSRSFASARVVGCFVERTPPPFSDGKEAAPAVGFLRKVLPKTPKRPAYVFLGGGFRFKDFLFVSLPWRDDPI